MNYKSLPDYRGGRGEEWGLGLALTELRWSALCFDLSWAAAGQAVLVLVPSWPCLVVPVLLLSGNYQVQCIGWHCWPLPSHRVLTPHTSPSTPSHHIHSHCYCYSYSYVMYCLTQDSPILYCMQYSLFYRCNSNFTCKTWTSSYQLHVGKLHW